MKKILVLILSYCFISGCSAVSGWDEIIITQAKIAKVKAAIKSTGKTGHYRYYGNFATEIEAKEVWPNYQPDAKKYIAHNNRVWVVAWYEDEATANPDGGAWNNYVYIYVN